MKAVSSGKQYKRDVKTMRKRGKDIDKLLEIVYNIANEQPLDPKHKDHVLIGDYKSFRDCHIEPDWLLVYSIDDQTIFLHRTGSHNDLF